MASSLLCSAAMRLPFVVCALASISSIALSLSGTGRGGSPGHGADPAPTVLPASRTDDPDQGGELAVAGGYSVVRGHDVPAFASRADTPELRGHTRAMQDRTLIASR
jgi:hypothetical protein